MIPSDMLPKYEDLPLSKSDLLADPTDQFATWFNAAQMQGEIEPSAMTLATVNKAYDVSARMVLLKSFDKTGFVFFTNYTSLKAEDLKQISKAALVFWWPKCQRQIRITGKVVLLEQAQSDAYFQQRNKGSQIAAMASNQSEIIPNRNVLLARYQKLESQYEGTAHIPRPDTWGGYRLQHQAIEFWQGRAHRLHDRFKYIQEAHLWQIVQLSP